MTADEHIPSRIPWPPLILAGVLVGAWLFGLFLPLPWPGLDDVAARVAGWFLIVLGVGVIAWAILTLKKHGTTVMPHKGAQILVTDGPFALRRNPIYLGDVFILLGLAIVTANLWFVVFSVVFVVLITWLAVLPEERHLEATFGEEYLRYKERVRRWI